MKTEEKELWEIAHDAYINNTTTASQDWKAVVQAVIAEHERRKAEQVKPEWKLPDPPEGEAWHRTDWTQEMLPDGWRPLLFGEVEQPEVDEFYSNGRWRFEPYSTQSSAGVDDYHRRTTRPLPVKPDPFATEKAAFAQGKVIQYFSKSSLEWLDCYPCPPSWEPTYAYRVKPDPVPYAAESSGQIVDLVESILRILKSQKL